MSRDAEFLKEVQKKFEQKLREHEISVIEHWKERLDRLYAMKPEGICPAAARNPKTLREHGKPGNNVKEGI